MSTLEQIFAKRELETGDGKKVLVTVGMPHVIEGLHDYICEFTITGIGLERVQRTVEIDAIQAVMLALETIGSELDAFAEREGTEIYLIDAKSPGHFFPTL